MNKLIVKVLGTPIGGVSRVDGDGDGFVTGPSGKDNIPAIPKAVKKLVRALKEKVISDKKTPRSKNSIEQREVSLSFNDAKGRKVTARVVSTIDYTNPDVPPRKDVSIWIADENGKNIGALFAKKGYPDPQGLNDLNDMNISDVTVDEDRQRSGLATAMMELASKYNVDGEEVKHSRRLSPQGKLFAEGVERKRKQKTIDKRTKDITKRIGEIFGITSNDTLRSPHYQDMLNRIKEYKREERKLDFQLQRIAKEQGFDGLPKVVSAKEMEELKKEGWAIAYRGIRPTDAGRWDLPAKRVDAETLAEQFRSGDYFVNSGTYGNGMYFAETEEMAQYYAGANGSIIKVAIPPNILMTQEEFREETRKHGHEIDKNENKRIMLPTASAQGDAPRGRGMFYGDDDLGRTLAAQGVRGAQFMAPIEGRLETIYLLFDRSMLVVQESGKKKKGKKK